MALRTASTGLGLSLCPSSSPIASGLSTAPARPPLVAATNRVTPLHPPQPASAAPRRQQKQQQQEQRHQQQLPLRKGQPGGGRRGSCNMATSCSPSPHSTTSASAAASPAAAAASAADTATEQKQTVAQAAGFSRLHHVGLLCEDLQRSLDFYCGVLGLEENPARPDGKLPYGGRWLWVGSGMIHLMELPNPDPTEGRPAHGGHDRHACIQIADVVPLKEALDKAGIPYTMSKSGRPALFCRDPDGNALEFAQFD